VDTVRQILEAWFRTARAARPTAADEATVADAGFDLCEVVLLASQSYGPLMARWGTGDLTEYQHLLSDEAWDFPFEPPARILDFGAGCGYSTVYFHKRFPEAEICAVEPDADKARVLAVNTSLGCGGSVSILETATVPEALAGLGWERVDLVVVGAAAVQQLADGLDAWVGQVRDLAFEVGGEQGVSLPDRVRMAANAAWGGHRELARGAQLLVTRPAAH
jgi:hypothetical protein